MSDTEDSDRCDETNLKTHDYKTVNPTHYPSTEVAANIWAMRGWRVVAVIPPPFGKTGHTHSLILERPVGIHHPDD